MAISDDDAKIRQSWQEGHKVCIFSNSRKKWFDGNVAQIFHDDEGEWLEIRYDKSMSKQVQRYSTDIKPTNEQRQAFQRKKQAEKKRATKQKPQSDGVPFPEQEMNIRKSWSKNDDVEIFSNTHQEWYRGEIVEIIKDEEGEWLNVVWARNNGEAMSKQVQRFSTDVRPVQDDSDSSDQGTDSLTDKLKQEILDRTTGKFVRRAPPFSRTIQASNFTNPASGSVRNKKRLTDIEEKDEEPKRVPTVEDWNETKVVQFIAGLGKAYAPYKGKFRGLKGLDLLQMDDKKMTQMGIEKLHRLKILVELAKKTDTEHANLFEDIESSSTVLNWDPKRVRKHAAKIPNLSQYALNLARHGVDGLLLFELDDEDLQTIGIRPVHRKKFFEAVDELHRTSFPNAPPLEMYKKANTQLDEQDEKSTQQTMAPNKTAKRRQSVMTVGSPGRSDFERDELLLEMANVLLKLGQHVSGAPDLKDSLETLGMKLSAFERQLSSSSMSNAKMGGDNFNGNDYDVSVDTSNLDDEDESDIGNGKISKLKNRAMERLEDVESPMGMNQYQGWMNTQNNKKGHRRRDSITIQNNNSKQVTMEDENEASDDEDNEDVKLIN